MLGLDPLYVANEGRFVIFVNKADVERTLAIIRADSPEKQASLIGRVLDDTPGLVTMKSRIGASRVVDMLSGEQLPRIC